MGLTPKHKNGEIVGCPPEEIRIGEQVVISYEDVTEDVTLPKFRKTDAREKGD
jgi:hypothetical protein